MNPLELNNLTRTQEQPDLAEELCRRPAAWNDSTFWFELWMIHQTTFSLDSPPTPWKYPEKLK
jgi:hypothetical protein